LFSSAAFTSVFNSRILEDLNKWITKITKC
jgi:hypothetical protein